MLYRGLAERYGWTSGQVDKLTLYQSLMYLGGMIPEDGKTVTLRKRQPTTRQARTSYGL